MQLTPNGQMIFDVRYAQKDGAGNVIESFEQAVYRLAKTAALAEKPEERSLWEEKFAGVIGNLLFVPATPIWANVGKSDRPWTPGSCYVLDVDDSLESMYQTLKDTALVFKSGGGVGYNFSKIRPKGSLVNTTKGRASGVVELIKLYDASSNMVMQGGVRRGASIGILDVNHPEIINFINAKLNGEITNFNLSVGITDEFMKAVENDADWTLRFEYHAGIIERKIQARELWHMILRAAHACGDPGLIFLDRLQEGNPIQGRTLNAVNPCGELPLFPNESCLLGSINLARMVEQNDVNYERVADVTETAVRFLDNLIDVAQYPLPQIETATKATRKIGLGFTGLADLLIKLGLPYDSNEGRGTAAMVVGRIQDSAHHYSQVLAEEKGVFPLWEESTFYPGTSRRNAACTAVAPTGSVTVIAGCEGYGVEPIFAVAYKKRTEVAGEFTVVSPLFLNACEKYKVPQTVIDEVIAKGTCQHIKGIPESVAQAFKCAREIAPEDHILMQATVQKYVDSAVSKTINLPNSATVRDVDKCYRMANELGLRGITVFRDGCKDGVVSIGREKLNNQKRPAQKLERGEIMPRPQSAYGVTHRLDTGCGKIYLTVNYQPETGEILETFITTGSDGGCQIYTEATSRLISLAIRGGIPVEEIAEQLESTHSCPSYQLARGKGKNVSPGKSCASAIAQKLHEVLEGLNGTHKASHKAEKTGLPRCEECGELMSQAEGCFVCRNCGFSKC